jgi:hypothetical protein
MKNSRLAPVVFLCISATFLAVAAWALLWVFSSYSMAFSACKGTFAWSSESLRCRQPYLAGSVCLLSLLLAGAFGILGLKARQ